MMTQVEKMRLLISIIARLERKHDGVAPLPEIERIAAKNGISKEFVLEAIQHEKAKGRLYSPTEGGVSRTAPTPFVKEVR